MTTKQLWLFNGLYLMLFIVVAILTRATARRITGAFAGGLAAGVVALGIIALGEKASWWHQVITWRPYFLTLFVIDFALFRVRLPHHVAHRPPLRLPRSHRGYDRRSGDRTATGLLVHDAVPGVGHLHVGSSDHPGRLRELRSLGDRWAWRDATCRWPGPRGPIGPLAMEGRPTGRWRRPLRSAAAQRRDGRPHDAQGNMNRRRVHKEGCLLPESSMGYPHLVIARLYEYIASW